MQSQEAFDALRQETVRDLETSIGAWTAEGRRVVATSSFQTQSVPLLHMLAALPHVQVALIDTGYLFPETYAFARELQAKFGFRLEVVRSPRTFAEQRTAKGSLLHSEDIEACCRLNKVEPMEIFLQPGEVWLSGIRADQTKHRAQKQRLETDARGVLRYHPMLAWTARDIYHYLRTFNLPKHPLEAAGYQSIGCVPCTRRWTGADARGARWQGSAKTECGLHLEPTKSRS